MRYILLVFLFSFLGSADCYEKYKIQSFTPNFHLYVIIDQTTELTNEMRMQVYNKLSPFITYGNSITLVKFSSNTNGITTEVVYEESIEGKLPEDVLYETSGNTAMQYGYCSRMHLNKAKTDIPKIITQITSQSNSNIPQSDILKNLKDISISKIGVQPAKHKIVLMVSDMLENSSLSNFYKVLNTEAFSADKEFKNIQKNRMIGNFGKANIYIIGTGTTKNKQFASVKSMTKLNDFWQLYFKSSNATVMEIGQPLLIGNLK